VDDGSGEARTLTVLPSGMLPPNPSELLESRQMSEIMDELQADFDLVIIDSPPLPVLTDALPLVRHVSGVIAVSALGKSQRDGVRELTRLIELSGGTLLGVVANLAPPVDPDALQYYSDRR
jgi:Mrp family chromosome partitioning ATPase